MQRIIARSVIDDFVEKLADIEHKRWSHWQRYLHGKCERQPDGSLVIPPELAERWQRQLETPYSDLTDAEKQSDRDQVQQYLPILLEALDVVPGDEK